MSAPAIGVIVLTYGTSGVHGALLESLWLEGVAPASVLVIHNPATPGEPDPELPAGCRLLRSDRNRGYAGGMNLAIAAWRERDEVPEWLLLLTHDARLRRGSLGALTEAAARHPEYGILAPALVLEGTTTPFSYGGTTDANGFTAHRKEQPVDVADGIAPCDWVDGGTMLVRSDALGRVGAFDERFWGYCEESDLALRMRRAGSGVGVVLAAIADQDPGAAKRLGAWAYLLTRNGAEYARRAVGIRGAVCVEARAVYLVALNLARVLTRTVRHRPGGPREPWILALATARGAIDFARRRWGPPPSSLPGMGDVGNV